MGEDEAKKWPSPEVKCGNLFQNSSVLLIRRKPTISMLTYFNIEMYTVSDIQQRKSVIHLVCCSL